MLMRTVRTLVLTAVAVALCGIAAAQTIRVAVNVKPQPMRAALKDLGAQAGVQILFRVEDVAPGGKAAPGVSGELSVQEALDRLLADTGLKYEFVNERTVRVSAVGDRAEGSESVETGAEKGPLSQNASSEVGSASAGSGEQSAGSGEGSS